ncbi:ABC transporter ATP-binding protein [Paenibacillus sp. LHD-38]|uniref:ABC transporter ATP-binding protein n=1 Tax=Paenibacillus sp. LHD-38 TaxID=3072143 RepID=UPI00280E32D6|nr:ABC transporter ATP-binding protein [Paenibacillus sp. LHD-38]MDQ8733034.1 ABC transporter ATP-binding protein [Paenibacillus sp. LHD-38]
MTNKEIIANIEDVSMQFNLSNEKISTMKEYFIRRLRGKISYNEFWALKNISFQINRGELFGILGLNGAGKSTLLKIIAGVLKPTYGSISVKGKLAPLIELGAGFDAELTARENIFLNGAVLGYSKKQMRENFDEIVSFSELEEFLDVPIKNFSSGMYARLGFSIATVTKPDILIVDEILSVGDFKFQQKCESKIRQMISDGTSVILVSHSLDQIRNMCSRGLILEKGEMVTIGDIDEVCNFYYQKYS